VDRNKVDRNAMAIDDDPSLFERIRAGSREASNRTFL